MWGSFRLILTGKHYSSCAELVKRPVMGISDVKQQKNQACSLYRMLTVCCWVMYTQEGTMNAMLWFSVLPNNCTASTDSTYLCSPWWLFLSPLLRCGSYALNSFSTSLGGCICASYTILCLKYTMCSETLCHDSPIFHLLMILRCAPHWSNLPYFPLQLDWL